MALSLIRFVLLQLICASQAKLVTFIDLVNSSFIEDFVVATHNVYVNASNRYDYKYTVEVDIKKPIRVLRGRFQLWFTPPGQRNSKYSRKYFDSNIVDVCKLFTNRDIADILVVYFMNLLDQFGKLPHSCPVMPKLYRFENITVSPMEIPFGAFIMGSADYNVHLQYFTKVEKKMKSFIEFGIYGGYTHI